VSLNVHACSTLDTFVDEIAEPRATRVFAKSPFEYGHDPDAAFTAILVVAALLVTRQPTLVVLAPHAATSDPAADSMSTLSVARVRRVGFISFTSPGARARNVSQ
jgi:hypothetical protein